VKKMLSWAAAIAAAIWLIKNPAGAAADVRQITAAISTFVSGL
jgi:hypothetical protein